MDYSNADEIACSKLKLSDLLDKISHLLHKMEKKGRKSRVTKKPYSNFSLSVQFSNFTLASYHVNDGTHTVSKKKKIKTACFHYKDGKLIHCIYHGI